MADEASTSDLSSSNESTLLLSSSPVTCEELQERIESLQHQNKVLQIELETHRLMEVELETCKSSINNLAEGMVESSHKPKTTNELA
ncbi:MAG: coiled-coil domain-containing protein 6, partial [Rickettsiales bacterium]|nr:coiled-coil domain-containing protein 6 [Rickettsiales bacterium]